ncbi:unnamed protein product [Nyctereutes procyonoides]|uniref:(raccoon dog) hypothetical protein n=1 Tax=Nyctereutes procyonoides TaxID=34880 RepID=A0A811ZKS7_NYCPR|nr:unnamed protein product [Nyctereutes procyonoides]
MTEDRITGQLQHSVTKCHSAVVVFYNLGFIDIWGQIILCCGMCVHVTTPLYPGPSRGIWNNELPYILSLGIWEEDHTYSLHFQE